LAFEVPQFREKRTIDGLPLGANDLKAVMPTCLETSEYAEVSILIKDAGKSRNAPAELLSIGSNPD